MQGGSLVQTFSPCRRGWMLGPWLEGLVLKMTQLSDVTEFGETADILCIWCIHYLWEAIDVLTVSLFSNTVELNTLATAAAYYTLFYTSKENWLCSASGYFTMRLLSFTHTRTHTHRKELKKMHTHLLNWRHTAEDRNNGQTCVYFVSLRFCILSQKPNPIKAILDYIFCTLIY